MNFVGITERFNESAQVLFSLLGSKYEKPIPILNKAPDHDRLALEDLSAAQLRAAAEANAYDVRLYQMGQRWLDYDSRNPVLRQYKWIRWVRSCFWGAR
jgi:hypothetical protein